LITFAAPNHVIVGDRAGIHKVLVEKDLVKAPFFDNMRLHPGNPMLVTERDKESHKRTVIKPLHLNITLISNTEASSIPGVFY